jgi:hypothetical protein
MKDNLFKKSLLIFVIIIMSQLLVSWELSFDQTPENNGMGFVVLPNLYIVLLFAFCVSTIYFILQLKLKNIKLAELVIIAISSILYALLIILGNIFIDFDAIDFLIVKMVYFIGLYLVVFMLLFKVKIKKS